jgi:transposase
MLLVGIDWAETEHAVCLLDDAGAVRRRLRVPHSAAGLGRLRAAVAEQEPAAGDVRRFPTAKQFVAHFGWCPADKQSGQYQRAHPPLSKAGDPHVRRRIWMLALAAVRWPAPTAPTAPPPASTRCTPSWRSAASSSPPSTPS